MSTKQLSITRTHKLNFYWSAFSQEPDAVYDIPHGVILHDWLSANVAGFDPDSDKVSYSQSLNDIVDGDIDCFFVPKGGAVQSILKPIFKLLGFNVSKPKTQQQQARGDDIELSSVQGNTVKFGEVVPEIFGRMKVFPDVLVPARRYFMNYREHWTEILLCVGVGEYDIPLSEVRFADSPVISLGADAYARVYQPNESLAGESCADWWHTCPEVGQTSSGSSGLPLSTIYNVERTAPDSQRLFSGKSITGSFPSGWQAGMYVSIRVLQSYTAMGDTLTGNFAGLQVDAGDFVKLDGDYSGRYRVLSYTPAADSTPGTPSKWVASGEPDFDYDQQVRFFLGAGSVSALIDAGIPSGTDDIALAINDALSQTPLRGLVQFVIEDDKLVIYELPVYTAKRITVTNISGSAALFGDIQAANENAIIGVSAQKGAGARLRLANFISDSSTVELSIAKDGERFVITGATNSLLTVERVKADGDSDWEGWGSGFRTSDSQIALDADSYSGGWVGVYSATPANELATHIEFDVMFPQGLFGVNKKGRVYGVYVTIEFQYRKSSSANWVSVSRTYRTNGIDAIAFTETIALPRAMQVKECRMRRLTEKNPWPDVSNDAEWFGLRAKLQRKPTRYPNFTTVAVRVKGSHAVAVEADSMLSVIATRKLGGVATRSIADAVRYICRRHPLDEQSLQRAATVWEQRGDTFNHAFEKQATIKQALDTVLSVGFAEPTVKDGLISVAHDMPRDLNLRKQVFSAQNTTAEIVTEISLPDDDEVDGIDVEYIDSRNYRVETVKCRLPGSMGVKVQKMQADGITSRNRAYRWGMRELSRIRYQRQRISTSTELDALNCNYGDLVAFVDDVPGYSQSALVVSKEGLVVTATERLDWSGSSHVAALRDEFGRMTEAVKVTRITDKSFRLSKDIDVKISPYETQVFFGRSDRFVRHAVVDSVSPQQGYNVTISANGYTDIIYAYDNAEADN